MPTPSEQTRRAESGAQHEEWAARPANPPRSIFPNYRAKQGENSPKGFAPGLPGPDRDRSPVAAPPETPLPGEGLQASIDTALSRSFLYRLLAQAYEDPSEPGWARMTTPDARRIFQSAIPTLAAAARNSELGTRNSELAEAAAVFQSQLTPEAFESFLASYLAAFGHAARGRCPLNEIEYGDIKADPLFQPHRLADLAAFYRAFGLDVAEDAGERHDHICLELEFMCVLAAKEAYALEHQLDFEDLSLCRDAQKRFLREHLGRWTPAFARRLARMAGDTALGALAKFTRVFIEAECARFGIAPGSEDLLLRPVDESAESMCTSCGLAQLPPGALPPAL